MMKLISLTIVFLSVLTAFAFISPAIGLAEPRDYVCDGVELTGGSCTETEGSPNVESTIATVINVLSIAVGVVAVIMIIIAGFRYITSGGDSNNVSGAKQAILAAIIGLVIVAAAQLIVRFVINQF